MFGWRGLPELSPKVGAPAVFMEEQEGQCLEQSGAGRGRIEEKRQEPQIMGGSEATVRTSLWVKQVAVGVCGVAGVQRSDLVLTGSLCLLCWEQFEGGTSRSREIRGRPLQGSGTELTVLPVGDSSGDVRSGWVVDTVEGKSNGLSDELHMRERGRRKTSGLKLEHQIKVKVEVRTSDISDPEYRMRTES